MKKAFLFCILVLGFIFSVYGQNISDFKYTVNGGAVTITEYIGSENDIVIPDSISGFPVTSIGEGAFCDTGLTSVIIPNSVTIISDGAFLANYLTNVIIPDSVTTIGRSAFAHNQLTEVIIPKSVSNIGVDAFDENVKIIRE